MATGNNGQGNGGHLTGGLERTYPPKHTPGPWKYDAGLDNWDNVFTDTEPPSHIASVYGADVSDGHDEYAANARLIAAAPDMLKALKAINAWMVNEWGEIPAFDDQMESHHGVMSDVQRAIARAEGGAA